MSAFTFKNGLQILFSTQQLTVSENTTQMFQGPTIFFIQPDRFERSMNVVNPANNQMFPVGCTCRDDEWQKFQDAVTSNSMVQMEYLRSWTRQEIEEATTIPIYTGFKVMLTTNKHDTVLQPQRHEPQNQLPNLQVTDTEGESLSLEIDTVNKTIKITTVDTNFRQESTTRDSIQFKQTRECPCRIYYVDERNGLRMSHIWDIRHEDIRRTEIFFETQKTLGHLASDTNYTVAQHQRPDSQNPLPNSQVTDTAENLQVATVEHESLSVEIDTATSKMNITVDTNGNKKYMTTNYIYLKQTPIQPCRIHFQDEQHNEHIWDIRRQYIDRTQIFFKTQEVLGHLTSAVSRGAGVCYTVSSNTQHAKKVRTDKMLNVRGFNEYFVCAA